jgi:AraC-like DNA-binding protein
MPDPVSPFLTTLLPIDGRALAAHANAVTGLLVGRTGPLTLDDGAGQRIEGDVLLVRPGVRHAVALAEGGADVLYLNGQAFPSDMPLAQALKGPLAALALKAAGGDADAMAELRARLGWPGPVVSERVAEAVRAIHADPMRRMSQGELARRLSLERTQALRCFKAATGQTFRAFKAWSALQHAAQAMARGGLVRTAAMDAGFADTAHLSRLFHRSFGLTPSAALAARAGREV